MFDFYTRDVPWEAFSDREKIIIEKTARTFAKALRREGFIEGKR